MMPSYVLVSENDSKKRHRTKEEALKEAERLCQKEGRMIEVYESIGEMQLARAPVEFHAHKAQDAGINIMPPPAFARRPYAMDEIDADYAGHSIMEEL